MVSVVIATETTHDPLINRGVRVRELTDEIVVDWHQPHPANDSDPDLLDAASALIKDRHVAEAALHPDGRLAVLTWSAPRIDPGLLHPAPHVIESGEVTDLATPRNSARSPTPTASARHC